MPAIRVQSGSLLSLELLQIPQVSSLPPYAGPAFPRARRAGFSKYRELSQLPGFQNFRISEFALHEQRDLAELWMIQRPEEPHVYDIDSKFVPLRPQRSSIFIFKMSCILVQHRVFLK